MSVNADWIDLAPNCAPAVHASTVAAIVRQESGGNPFAIGVVGGRLRKQPRSTAEALATARSLEAAGWNYSVGLAQINRANFARLGLSHETAFDPCTNLRAMQTVLLECWRGARVHPRGGDMHWVMQASIACYYSGSFAVARYSNYVNGVLAKARLRRKPHRD